MNPNFIPTFLFIAARKEPDFDAEEEEALAEVEDDEENFLSELSKAIHEIFKTHSVAFLPAFEALMADFDTFLVCWRTSACLSFVLSADLNVLLPQASAHSSARQLGMCVYDDLLEYCGPQSFQYHERFLQRMIACLGDTSPDVRQAAAYGVGLAGALGGEQYAGACAQAIPMLFTLINQPDARSEDNLLATENAVSAVGKICHFNSSQFDVNQVLTAWVEALPIVEDEEEMNGHTYVFLCDLIDGLVFTFRTFGANFLGAYRLPISFPILLSADTLPSLLETPTFRDSLASSVKCFLVAWSS